MLAENKKKDAYMYINRSQRLITIGEDYVHAIEKGGVQEQSLFCL